MMDRKEIVKKILIISCVIILFFLCALVIRIINPGLIDVSNIFFRSAFLIIITSMAVSLIYQIYNKPLKLEMEEEKTKEEDQKYEKQLLFKPSLGALFFSLFLIFMGIVGFLGGIDMISLKKPIEDAFVFFGFSLFLIGLSLYIWYKVPVFIFADDSVQIKPYLLYIFGIDRKTIIRYADITSVSPDAEYESSSLYHLDSKLQMVISMNGTAQKYGLFWFNSDLVAKLYLRFKEKLGDKVTME